MAISNIKDEAKYSNYDQKTFNSFVDIAHRANVFLLHLFQHSLKRYTINALSQDSVTNGELRMLRKAKFY